jgi:O-methyltransferase involved in polyketide biosynthesis
VLGENYTLAACDISDLTQFKAIIDAHKIDLSLPTLFYSECVLSYIDADRVDDFVAYIGKSFDLAFLFDYEMYNPNDRFGQLMVKNFDARGCPLIGIRKYPDLKDQHVRYSQAGFKRTEVFTMQQMYQLLHKAITIASTKQNDSKLKESKC